MKLSLEILYTSAKDDGLSYGENRTCLATLVFEIYRKQKIVSMWLINFVTHCMSSVNDKRTFSNTPNVSIVNRLRPFVCTRLAAEKPRSHSAELDAGNK